MLLELWQRNKERVRQAGQIALERARIADVPAYYRESGEAGRIVKVSPNGEREFIEDAETPGAAARTTDPRA